MSKSKKSNVKKLGIKSVFQVKDSNNSLLYITKFGKGNEAESGVRREEKG